MVGELATRMPQSLRIQNTEVDAFTALLKLLSDAPALSTLSLEGIPSTVNWKDFISTNHKWASSLLSLCLKGTLQNLQIIRFDKFDRSFITAPNSSRRLKSFSLREAYIEQPEQEVARRISSLEVEYLELFTFMTQGFFSAFINIHS